MPDTIDLIQGTWNAALGAVVGLLPVQPYNRRITSIVIKGPARSTFTLYRGSRLEPSLQVSRTPTQGGGDNTYDSTTDGAPVLVGAGEQMMGAWSGGASGVGQTGTATVRSRWGT